MRNLSKLVTKAIFSSCGSPRQDSSKPDTTGPSCDPELRKNGAPAEAKNATRGNATGSETTSKGLYKPPGASTTTTTPSTRNNEKKGNLHKAMMQRRLMTAPITPGAAARQNFG